MTRLTALLCIVAIAAVFTACSTSEPSRQEDESARANALFETFFEEDLARSPMRQTYLGIKTDYDKWDNISDAFEAMSHALRRDQLARLSRLNPENMDAATALSFRLQRQVLEDAIADYRWRHHNYPVNQMFGIHTTAPSLLINQHHIDNRQDAEAYITRLAGIAVLFDQLIDGLRARAEKGIVMPKFVFPYAIEASNNIITGAPFGAGDDSVLYADFKRKIGALQLTYAQREALLTDASTALRQHVKPAYEKLIRYLVELEQQADTRDGAWKFPEGEAFYNNALARTTTTSFSAAEIHIVGLEEVARIHSEMRDIMKQVNFAGDLAAFFTFMRTDPQFYYPEDEASKEAYLAAATAIIDNMESRLDELFLTRPKAALKVQRVEAFREKSAGKAFYQRPSMDGSRPGLYYANLYRMSNMPTYQMEALAYHEGIPGHHMQIAIAQELEGIPQFRKFGGYTAYVEGWGLYSEWIPKQMGLYQDPYSDFGRLAMELWRACRLVVDTGIHAKQWTRQQAIDYLKANTPNPEGDIVNAIERYIVIPSQATAYKIGMLKIQQLRATSEQALGKRFDIRQFHDVVLRNGPVPLNVLEDLVDRWVQETKRG
ncbi:DUF885 domain-containing protein [Exilibacterium tricleocarpae]|uniref:DUF885 domain-containing protein n=1 Tax=Exilibacterium tricleocarpae TaxID=2591008 RepID=A0A545U9I3_9GAMM|nr:DUF885 domain-containing protein [Exilibacterium tricleocarpae]TQV86099.1 DUF885 domain-containing protein [Exilibacterium tricleocarpae]